MPRRTALLTAAGLLLASCGTAGGAEPPPPPPTPTSTAPPCIRDALPTALEDRLTIATDKPVSEPWFVDDDPANKEGFESALAWALAGQLGFPDEEVLWVRYPAETAVAPGEKKFDLAVNEFVITPARERAVDFSPPYTTVTQAVVAVQGSAGVLVSRLGQLRGLRIGTVSGTTASADVVAAVRPVRAPQEFRAIDEAVAAMQDGTIDALVVSLPTAQAMVDDTGGAGVDGARLVGQLPSAGGPGRVAVLLGKGSALTACVDAAVRRLETNGTLERLRRQWLPTEPVPPVLR